MNIWYPLNFSESHKDNIKDYQRMCITNLYKFKGILLRNINISRWRICSDIITSKFDISDDYNLKRILSNIPKQYVNTMNCFYDAELEKCYYKVPEKVKCFGLNYSLDSVVRLIEYGYNNSQPMNWIRHSYLEFVDYINRN